MLNSLLVIGLIIFVSLHVMTKLQKINHLKRPAFILMLLGILQMMLGILAYVVRVVQGASEAQPTVGLVGVTVAHQGVGALILLLAFVLTIQAHRHTRDSGQVVPFNNRDKLVSA